MPELNVETKTAKEVWKSPDGERVIYELGLEWEGQAVKAKSYSNEISTVGWKGTVETYEKPGRNGIETFVKQPPKEDSSYKGGTQSGSTSRSYQPKDEKAIQAMWAIGQVVQLLAPTQKKVVIDEIEVQAQELFLMVDRVKVVRSDEIVEVTGSETNEDLSDSLTKTLARSQEEEQPIDLAQIEAVFGPTGEKPWPPKK